MFRGSAPATIDEKGRLKVPADFRKVLEDNFGPELPDFFVTSIAGDRAFLYPLPVWEGIEARLAKMPSTDRARARYLERANYYGQQVKADAQGRLVIPQILREAARMNGEVVVNAQLDHLEVWNRERIEQRFAEDPFTEDDYRALAEHGI
ncbi:MAG TPA: division/cell wall cluster transcriptional repressor MraZ [Thermoanaerobaculia bacterium]|nr:division/cell wall cluster transcriptional repressor MraZ [Thermoanaerobaculia bacterium]